MRIIVFLIINVLHGLLRGYAIDARVYAISMGLIAGGGAVMYLFQGETGLSFGFILGAIGLGGLVLLAQQDGD